MGVQERGREAILYDFPDRGADRCEAVDGISMGTGVQEDFSILCKV